VDASCATQDILDWLLANREGSLTPAQIQKRFGYACSEGSQLHNNLLANNKVGVSADGAFTYKVILDMQHVVLMASEDMPDLICNQCT